MSFAWIMAQKGGPDLGSVSGVDRTLRGELDRDGSGIGCLGGTWGLSHRFRGLSYMLGVCIRGRGGHSVGFLTICLPVFLDVYHMDMDMIHECRQVDGDPRDLEHEQD